ncbi:hypothetical protein BVRB_4g096210 [Beta vulgaris subsp. vulgaris]|uniref:Uncharacterized protein n=1 Tax=Beta vulgaris subsp. vulgaris TaxID=3555 RepID=A0A0J8E4J8_BETVV|nr:hypothetical protein BVRB_4g096210 [Beta vulgaris subsp. vulgaris]
METTVGYKRIILVVFLILATGPNLISISFTTMSY